MSDQIHLVRAVLDPRGLDRFVGGVGGPGRGVELGYAVHAYYAALFDCGAAASVRMAPKPFHANDSGGGGITVLGYSRGSADTLRDRAERFADPAAWAAAVCRVQDIVSKPMPERFPDGLEVAFEVRAAPTRRVKGRGPSPRDRAEVDAFLAATWQVAPDVPVDREAVYRAWLEGELGRDGAAALVSVEIAGFRWASVIRRTHGDGPTKRHESVRPDVTFRGVLKVRKPEAFSTLLARGVGRHRAFGFGMLLLAPPP